jgi:hypothetical protein
MLSSQGALKSVGSEKVMRTEFGTPTRCGVDLQSDDLDITIDPITGRILSIETTAVAKPVTTSGMNEVQAVDAAKIIVQKIGSKVDHGMQLIHRSFDAATGRWKVAWEKRIDGYPFPEETVFVSFNDRDQKIVSFRDRTSDQVCLTKPVIEVKNARASAERLIRNLLPDLFGEHYEIANITQGKLQVVYPNRQYLPQGRSDKRIWGHV